MGTTYTLSILTTVNDTVFINRERKIINIYVSKNLMNLN